MARKKPKKIPRFFGLRIYLSSTILYYWLVMPFLLLLVIKYSPQLNEQRNRFINQDNTSGILGNQSSEPPPSYASNQLISPDSIPGDSANADTSDSEVFFQLNPRGLDVQVDDETAVSTLENDGSQIGDAFNLLFNLILISLFLGFLFNLPFKRYFSRKRKRKKINEKLFRYCKRFLIKSPVINASILGIAYLVAHVFMLINLLSDGNFNNHLEKTLYQHLFYISLTASVLSLLFVYFWEKHRVHIRYIEHIFTPEELRKRIFNLKVGRIRNRLFLSSAMTTLLPLTIVILYLFLSVTYLDEIPYSTYSVEAKDILFGDYQMFLEMFGNQDQAINTPGFLFYINAVNSLLMFIGINSSIFIAFIYILFLVKWTTQDIVHPVKELLLNMRKTGKGEMENFSIVRTNDEIGELAEGYNDMTQKIGEYITNISRMTEAYSHFVPRQFLDFLGKKSFVDIRLGDQVEKEMTVLFSDIRSFTEISEQMTPKENFDYLNYYLGYMEPVIRNNNGFIDKYIGDSIMALFSETAEDAINASIEMRIKLSQFNQVMDQFGKPTINSGIGIHSGILMLGVVGGEGRMDGTVISDAVNLAARLEGLTKLYGSSIIISQDTLIKLSNPAQYNYRFLDIVKVKGKKEAVYIFEVIDGDSEDVRQLKIKTKITFAEGINLYKLGKFKEALKAFDEVYGINQHDTTARLYISRCKRFLDYGVPSDWDGIERIEWN